MALGGREAMYYSYKKIGSILLACLFIIFLSDGVIEAKSLNSKNKKKAPQARLASYASSTILTHFLGPDDLGPHSYRHSIFERNGIVYTTKAGHIDIAHVRKFIDWTAFLTEKTYANLMKNKTEFKFKTKAPSIYHVEIVYPAYWKVLSEKQKEYTAYSIAIKLGQYFAYTESVWHEILTWFGFKTVGFCPEFPSAFSWEDTFSNVFGTHIAVMALQDEEHEYDEAVTFALNQELAKLGIQSANTARRKAERMRGRWFSGDVFVDIKKRNFDIGLENGFVTPCVTPSFTKYDTTIIQSYPVPNLDFLSDYGFTVRLEIEPKEWEKGKILKIVYPEAKTRNKRICPVVHFAPIMDHIKKAAASKYNKEPEYQVATAHQIKPSGGLPYTAHFAD